jgi:hypothetical protein
MDQRRQWSSMDHQPGNESAKLLLCILVRDFRGFSRFYTWCEDVDFEHSQRMGTYWPIPHSIDPKLGDYEFWLQVFDREVGGTTTNILAVCAPIVHWHTLLPLRRSGGSIYEH